MPALSYQMVYAGVPFFNDDAQSYRFSRIQGEVPGRSPVRDQQTEQYLWDEIERLLPTEYLQDMGYAQLYPGRNTGSLARQVRGNPEPNTKVRLGDFYYPNNASRWSYFRGLATSSQVKAMLEATQGNKPALFTIEATPESQGIQGKTYGVYTYLYMLPARPLGELAGSFDGLYLVTLVDERYFWQYSPQTQHFDFNTTWDDLLAQITGSLNITLDYSTIPNVYLGPEPDSQLWVNHEDVALLLDTIAYNIGRIVVRGFDGVYSLYTPQESLTQARENRVDDKNTVMRLAGGDCFASGTSLPVGTLQKQRNIAPTAVRVTFPKYVTEEPVPHFAQFRGDWSRWFLDSYEGTYFVDTPISSGGSSGQLGAFSGLSGSPFLSGLGGSGSVSGNGIHTIFNTAKALYLDDQTAESGTPTNQSELRALANQITRDYYAQTDLDGLDEVYLGILNWVPEGLHDLLFTWSARRRIASTRVMRSEFNLAVRDMQHATPAAGGGVGYPWTPGLAILGGYTVSDQGNVLNILNLNITNINLNGGVGSTTNLTIPAGSFLNFIIQGTYTIVSPPGVCLNIAVACINIVSSLTIDMFEDTALLIEDGVEFSIRNGDAPDTSLFTITTDALRLTFVLPPSVVYNLTTSTTPGNGLLDIIPTPLKLTFVLPPDVEYSLATGTDETEDSLFTITSPGDKQLTFDIPTYPLGPTISLTTGDLSSLLATFQIDDPFHPTTALPDNVTWSISSSNTPNDYIASFFIVDPTQLRQTIADNRTFSITGGNLLIQAFLIIDGPLQEIAEEEPDPVDDAEENALFVIEDAPIVKMNIVGNVDINGMERPTDGRDLRRTILNTGTGTATFHDSSPSALPSNQILTPNAQSIEMPPNGSVESWYDSALSKFRIFAPTPASSAGFTGNKTVVTAVTCSEGSLVVTSKTWSFQDGRFLSEG